MMAHKTGHCHFASAWYRLEMETIELRHPARDRTTGGRDQWSADYLHSPMRDRTTSQCMQHDGTAGVHVYGRVRYNRRATPDGSREL
jgi:hypothetical protein